jgi:hypothetical protein
LRQKTETENARRVGEGIVMLEEPAGSR